MKKVLSIFLVAVMIATSISFMPAVAKAEDYKCGDDITWNWDGKTHTLTLSGTGEMYNYDYGSAHPKVPGWAGYEIENLYIGEGITSIGDLAFYQKSKIIGLTLPTTIRKIGKKSFYGLTKITGVYLPYGVETVGEFAFAEVGKDSYSGAMVNIPSTLTTFETSAFYNANIREIHYCGRMITSQIKEALKLSATPDKVLDESHNYQSETILGTFGKDGLKGEGICTRCHSVKPNSSVETIPMLMDPIVSPQNVVYDGQPHKPSVAVFNSENKLCNPTIINFHDAEFIDAGTYTISLNYSGNSLYTGLKTVEYVIAPAPKAVEVKLDKVSFDYTGKVQKPVAAVTSEGKALATEEYDIEIPESADAGKYTVTVQLKGNFAGTAKATYEIKKATQSPKVVAKKKTVKAKKLKKKKQSVKKAISVKNGIGLIGYKKVKKGSSKKLSINKKNGTITVKKGTKKGTYKIKVKVSVAGDKNYQPFSKVVTVKIKVK
jgi:hypothetical protein